LLGEDTIHQKDSATQILVATLGLEVPDTDGTLVFSCYWGFEAGDGKGLCRNEDKCCSCEMKLLHNHAVPYMELIFMHLSMENQTRQNWPWKWSQGAIRTAGKTDTKL